MEVKNATRNVLFFKKSNFDTYKILFNKNSDFRQNSMEKKIKSNTEVNKWALTDGVTHSEAENGINK